MTMACVFRCRGKLYINQNLSPHFSLGVSPTPTHAHTHTPLVDTAEAQRCRGWVRAECPAACSFFHFDQTSFTLPVCLLELALGFHLKK